MYLFGGHQQYGVTTNCWRSTMWRYAIDVTCTPHICTPNAIYQLENISELNIFPNPTSSSLMISIELLKSQRINFKICNLLGKEIYNYNKYCNSGMLSHQVNLEHYSNGIYFVQIQMEKIMLTHKIVKQ